MKRLLYIDNLRILLVSLVVLHHLMITYGGPGGWYYSEVQIDGPEILFYAMFLATNQSFFMAMFFMISAFFTLPALQRKGNKLFLKDRLTRLGIPLVVYYFFLNPLTNFIIRKMRDGIDMNFFQYWWNAKAFGFGPMWFVEALLLFTLIYVILCPLIRNKEKNHQPGKLPGAAITIFTAVGLGIFTFLVRIWLPVGWVFEPLGFQFPHFVQYIGFFIFGILAYQNNWFEQLRFKYAIRWFWTAQIFVFIGFPALFTLGGALELGEEVFMGGLHWQALGYAIWEQITGFALIIGLSGLFARYFNRQRKVAKSLSASAYTAYIIHAPVIVYLALDVSGYQLYPLIKFLLLAPVALIVVFALSDLIRRLPLLRNVL